MDDYISREEHNEFVRRMEEEHHRQNRRIELLEEAVRQNGKLTISVEKMAVSLQTMGETLAAQGDRLESLEKRDGQKWRKMVEYVATAIIGIIIGFIASQLGLK